MNINDKTEHENTEDSRKVEVLGAYAEEICAAKFMIPDEVRLLFDCSRATAYRIIKKLNDELEEDGYLVIPGKVLRSYLCERHFNSYVYSKKVKTS